MQPEPEYKPGSLVQLVSHGNALTIRQVFRVANGYEYEVIWFDRHDRIRRSRQPEHVLIPYIADGDWR